jgi:hypothetical protein
MALKPRYVFPLNFRSEDLEILNAAVQIAKDEASDLTAIMREALRQYTKSKLKSVNIKMDAFLDHVVTDPIFGTVLLVLCSHVIVPRKFGVLCRIC